MTEMVTKNHWWPGVTSNIGKYVDGCDIYQRIKNRMEKPVEKLKLSKVPEKLWTYLMVDFITKLPLVAGKDQLFILYYAIVYSVLPISNRLHIFHL